MKSVISNSKFIDDPAWKVVAIHAFAKLIGVHVKMDGIPLGSPKATPLGGYTGPEQAK